MSYLTFCELYNYNQRDDSARESFNAFVLSFKFISMCKNKKLLSFLSLNLYTIFKA